MVYVVLTSHRRAIWSSHRGHCSADGLVQITSWFGLTFAFVVGLILTAQAYVGVYAAGVMLLVMLVPITIGMFVAVFKQGVGSWAAALLTAGALAFILLKFFL